MDTEPALKRRESFHTVATRAASQFGRDLMDQLPEVRGVACVLLYDLPDQSNIPSIVIAGADGAITSPADLAQLQGEVCKLQNHLTKAIANGVDALRMYAEELARQARTTEPNPEFADD